MKWKLIKTTAILRFFFNLIVFHDFCDLITRFCFTLIMYVKYIKLCNKVSFTKGSEHFNILLPPPLLQVANQDLHITSKILALSLCLVVLYRTSSYFYQEFLRRQQKLAPNEKLSIWIVTTGIYRYKFYIGQEFSINSEYELIETVIAQQYKQQRSTWNMKCKLMTLVHMLQFLNAIQSSKIFYKLSNIFKNTSWYKKIKAV